jgi:hypothetical protein
VHQFNPRQRFLCGVEVLESQHRTTAPLGAPVILFDDVVEILALANFNALVVVMIVVLNRRCVRAALIDIDEARFPIPLGLGARLRSAPTFRHGTVAFSGTLDVIWQGDTQSVRS